MKYIYTIGQKINRLTIIGTVTKRNQKQILCNCDCGKQVTTMPYNLFNNKTKSCGCHKRDTLKLNRKYQPGDKLGIMILQKELPTKNGKRRFLINCQCGTTKEITIHYGMKSCGCIKRTSTDPDNTEYKKHLREVKTRKLTSSLTKKEFSNLIHKNCYYCDNPPSMKMRTGKQFRNGIDRADNNKGYTIENSLSCCANCNYAKRTLSFTEFRNLIEKIYHHLFEDNVITLDIEEISA